MPVEAIPIDRIRAPERVGLRLARPGAAVAPALRRVGRRRDVELTEPDQQHRPRERRARLDDLAVAREQRARRSASTSG